MRVALAAALLVFTVFGARLVQLQGVDAAALAAKALKSRSAVELLPAHRGDILDTTGAKLATSYDTVSIVVDQLVVTQYNIRTDLPREQKGVAGAARALAPLLDLSVPFLTAKLTGDRGYAYVAKGVSPIAWRNAAKLAIPGPELGVHHPADLPWRPGGGVPRGLRG